MLIWKHVFISGNLPDKVSKKIQKNRKFQQSLAKICDIIFKKFYCLKRLSSVAILSLKESHWLIKIQTWEIWEKN